MTQARVGENGRIERRTPGRGSQSFPNYRRASRGVARGRKRPRIKCTKKSKRIATMGARACTQQEDVISKGGAVTESCSKRQGNATYYIIIKKGGTEEQE